MPARNTTEEAAHQKSRCGAGDRRSQPCSISWPKGARLTCEIDEGIRRGERRGIGRGGNGGVWVGEPSSQDPRLPRVVAQAPRTSTNRPLIQRPCALFSSAQLRQNPLIGGGAAPLSHCGADRRPICLSPQPYRCCGWCSLCVAWPATMREGMGNEESWKNPINKKRSKKRKAVPR